MCRWGRLFGVAWCILYAAVPYCGHDRLSSPPAFGTAPYRVSPRSDRQTPISWTHDSRNDRDVRVLDVALVLLER